MASKDNLTAGNKKTEPIKKSISRRKFVGIGISGIAVAGIATFLKKCTSVLGPNGILDPRDIVDCAFRLTDHKSLLNLEYYFINCTYKDEKVWAKYGPHENYMIVRLPQQHIAEKSFETDDQGKLKDKDFKAATYIAGYSYLVFRILFPDDGFFKSMFTGKDDNYTYINLKKEELLDWDCERKYRLVVRQDLTESLFELTNANYFISPEANKERDYQDSISLTKDVNEKNRFKSKIDSIRKPFLENKYPFQTINQEHNKLKNPDSLRINRVPKVYSDPITAIELPWRLIISPRIPDSSKFKFKWEFPETDLSKISVKDQGKFQLWTATLTITERTDDEYRKRKISEQDNNEEAKNASTSTLNELINQLELMILGSPDYPNVKFNPKNLNGDITLPTGAHRTDLVALYIKLRILARTEKLTLSATGATIKIHLKNEKIEDALKLIPSIAVIEWNQIISLGRDEKVEVSTLFLEAEFGHKMAYIIIAERKLKDGVYALIKKKFIVPLDITKDYTNHITQSIEQKDNTGKKMPDKIVSRFNAPFKKITFLETKPKELIMDKDSNGKSKEFKQDELNQTKTSFQFEAIDWHDNTIRFTKEINAITFNYALSSISGDDTLTKNLKTKVFGNDNIYQNDPSASAGIKDTSKLVFKDLNTIGSDPKNDSEIKIKSLDSSINEIKNSTTEFTRSLDAIYLSDPQPPVTIRIDNYLNEIENYYDNFFQYIKNFISELYSRSDSKFQDITDKINAITHETIRAFLIEHYFFIDKDNFEKLNFLYKKISNTVNLSDEDYLKQVIKSKFKDIQSIDGFNSYLKSIFHETIITDFGHPSDNNLKDEDIERVFKQINYSFKIEFEKWLITYEPDIFLADDKLVDSVKIQLKNQIATDFPEVSKVLINFQLLFQKDSAKIQTLIDNIKQRLMLFYNLEQKAKEIPGLILLQKQKIGYAIKEKYDEAVNNVLGKSRNELEKDLKNSTGQVKKSLSELESEYIIFQGGLRQAESKVFDFFHEYAIIPQVNQAKVYVSELNKLVNEDLPISINYARDYLENQVRDAEFEVKQNAAMVFAEVKQFSREQVRGLIQKVGNKMPGFNIEIPAHYLTYARNPQELATVALNKVQSELGFSNDFKDQLQNYSRDLIFISEDVKNAVKVIDDLRNVDPKKYFKDLGAKLFGSIGLEDILDIGFDVPRITQLPDKLIYQVSTDKFKNFQAAFVIFKPNVKDGNPTRLELFVSKSLKNVQEYYSYTQLNNFSVGIVIGGTEVLTITFEQFKITSSSNQPKKTDVSITDVKLGGPLEFIADLAKKFMAPGNGMRIKPGPRSLSVDYTIVLPDIKAPAFNFRNLQLVIGVNIPYDPSTLKAISFTFGVNKPEDKFLVSAGIYGGRGHFQLRATPKGIDRIDVAIELGAYASIDLGIGKGEVFLFFGFWFITGKDENNENFIKAVAYVLCAGSATVLGFITIGVSVLIALTYIKRGNASLFYGEAVVTYSVKIAFFKKEFSLRYYKEIAGSSKGNNSQSLQTGAIFLDTNVSNTIGANNKDKEMIDFIDVFKDEKALEEYLLCFA